jgi:two-component system capsular synthesis sensor histidine kinase RcsC
MVARILVVDDDPLIRSLLGWHLRAQGYRVDEAETADIALERLAASRFDLLITDVHLPGSSGLWLLGEVRARWTDLPVILVTGEFPAGDAHRAADAVLLKPFRVVDLLRHVDRVLRG